MLLEEGAGGGPEPGRGGVQWVCGSRLGADLGGDQLIGFSLAGEDHLALVREVMEEGPSVQASPLGNLRHRRLLEALLGEEGQRRVAQAPVRVGFPSDHGPILL